MIIAITPGFTDGKQILKPEYVRAIESIGGTARNIPYESDPEAALDGADGLILSGGADVEPCEYGCEREEACGESIPARDKLELRLMQIARERKLPVLGVCRGCQLVNVAFSGTLTQDVPTRYHVSHKHAEDNPSPFDHDVFIQSGTRLSGILEATTRVNSYHHQSIDRIGEGLIAGALSPEGFPEAIETRDPDWFVLAVQWHPELTREIDAPSQRIFDLFAKAIKVNLR